MPADPVIQELCQLGAGPALSALGLRTDGDLWKRLGSNRSGELSLLSMQIGIPPLTLLDVLARSALKRAGQFNPPWWKRQSLDYVLAITVVGFVALGGLALSRVPPARKRQVVAVSSIQPFVPIQRTNIKTEDGARVPGSEEKPENVAGRYALKAIPPGTVIASSELSKRRMPGTMAGRFMVRIPLSKADIGLAKNGPTAVTLMISPGKPGQAGTVIRDVYLLAADAGDAGALAALPANSLDAFAAAIGSGTVYIALPGR
jgi:hypothetical protein